MITLLLAFFIVLYASSRVDGRKYSDLVSSIRIAFGVPLPPRPIVQAGNGGEMLLPFPDVVGMLVQQLSSHVEEEIKTGSVEIERNEKGLILRFQDTVLFGLGSATLSDDAKKILDKVARPLFNMPYAIEVEGHTDRLQVIQLPKQLGAVGCARDCGDPVSGGGPSIPSRSPGGQRDGR
jgi:chemotaxis protein MotB